jgi:hypothetical protein
MLMALMVLPALATPPWLSAVGEIEDRCTVWALRPSLLVTASHCVGVPGSTYDAFYYRGVGKVKTPALLVWDGAWEDGWYADLALLVPDRPWPAVLPLASRLPGRGEVGQSVSWSLGTRQWVTPVWFYGLHEVSDKGWVVIFRGDVGPGSSGGVALVNGQVVGVIVAGYAPLGLHLAIPAGSVGRAVRSLERNGPMPRP